MTKHYYINDLKNAFYDIFDNLSNNETTLTQIAGKNKKKGGNLDIISTFNENYDEKFKEYLIENMKNNIININNKSIIEPKYRTKHIYL